jgi:hypothetical protein
VSEPKKATKSRATKEKPTAEQSETKEMLTAEQSETKEMLTAEQSETKEMLTAEQSEAITDTPILPPLQSNNNTNNGATPVVGILSAKRSFDAQIQHVLLQCIDALEMGAKQQALINYCRETYSIGMDRNTFNYHMGQVLRSCECCSFIEFILFVLFFIWRSLFLSFFLSFFIYLFIYLFLYSNLSIDWF